MNLIISLIIGGIIGWLASIVMKTNAQMGIIANVLVGIVGAALGHDVPRVFMLVFGGGAALAGLAGVIGGNAFITEPGMAALVGAVVCVVVVVGGMGWLPGAFLASLLIGCLQTFSVALDWSVAGALAALGVQLAPGRFLTELASITISPAAPVRPYLLMVWMLIFRPRGLMGTRDS